MSDKPCQGSGSMMQKKAARISAAPILIGKSERKASQPLLLFPSCDFPVFEEGLFFPLFPLFLKHEFLRIQFLYYFFA